jgi:hypothetical protein
MPATPRRLGSGCARGPLSPLAAALPDPWRPRSDRSKRGAFLGAITVVATLTACDDATAQGLFGLGTPDPAPASEPLRIIPVPGVPAPTEAPGNAPSFGFGLPSANPSGAPDTLTLPNQQALPLGEAPLGLPVPVLPPTDDSAPPPMPEPEPPAPAEPAPAPGPVSAPTMTATEAHVRWLDRLTGRTADLWLQPGASLMREHLLIRLDECRVPQSAPASDAFAYLVILDTRTRQQLFAGWMIASSPALSAMDHPRYDVWLIGCAIAARSGQ